MFMIFPSQNAKLIYSVESLSLEPMQDVGVVYLTVVTPFEYMEWSWSLVRNCVDIICASSSEHVHFTTHPKFHMERSKYTTNSKSLLEQRVTCSIRSQFLHKPL